MLVYFQCWDMTRHHTCWDFVRARCLDEGFYLYHLQPTWRSIDSIDGQKSGDFFHNKGKRKEKNNLCLSLGHFDARTMAVFGGRSRSNTSALQRHLATLPTPLPIKFMLTELLPSHKKRKNLPHWSCVVLGWGGVAFIRLRSPKSFFGTLLMRNTGAVRCRGGGHSEDKNWRVASWWNCTKLRIKCGPQYNPRRSIMFNRNMLYSVYIYM